MVNNMVHINVNCRWVGWKAQQWNGCWRSSALVKRHRIRLVQTLQAKKMIASRKFDRVQ